MGFSLPVLAESAGGWIFRYACIILEKGFWGFRGVRATLVVAPHWAGTRPVRPSGVNPLNSQRAKIKFRVLADSPRFTIDLSSLNNQTVHPGTQHQMP